jgi:chromosome partitioning protein
MKTIAIAASKGGAGKSTITSALAVEASRESMKVSMIDLNADQGNLTQWWLSRGEPMVPMLAGAIENIPDDVRQLAVDGFDWCFIDTPPVDMNLIEASVQVADAVIIPVRTSIFDATSIDPVVDMCRKHRTPFAFVLSAVDSRFKKLTAQTVSYISKRGPLLANQVSYRQQYIQALTAGKSGPEIEKDLHPEISGLWAEVKRLAEGGSK